ncbi:hypothetical protein TIFTF001_037053 [Ficus carica]|uniref:Uncharacterized protein n=1 Tax=Ficus carica TaxID=3494 RepID=A0AA88E5K6_FICCA|nr:hypothetical protein TIFTF001_037048 [Ficus carica]GMN67995.1 hypothetical protein TIFTF001_037053 [Ficus carica]
MKPDLPSRPSANPTPHRRKPPRTTAPYRHFARSQAASVLQPDLQCRT